MITKQCGKCEQDKPLAEFHKGNTSYEKHFWCKSCRKHYHLQYYLDYLERGGREVVRRNRKRQASRNKERRPLLDKKYRLNKNNQCKCRARSAITRAKRNGGITPSTICEKCNGNENIEAHHWSYDEEHWLNVLWLCRNCHTALHEAQNHKLRRRKVFFLDAP